MCIEVLGPRTTTVQTGARNGFNHANAKQSVYSMCRLYARNNNMESINVQTIIPSDSIRPYQDPGYEILHHSWNHNSFCSKKLWTNPKSEPKESKQWSTTHLGWSLGSKRSEIQNAESSCRKNNLKKVAMLAMFLTLFDFFKVFAVMIWMLSDLFDRSRKPWSHFCWGLDLTPWEYLSKRLCSTNEGTTNPPNETCRAGLYLQEWSALNRRQLHAGMMKSHCVFCSCNLVVFTSQLWLIGDTAVESEVYESQKLVGQMVWDKANSVKSSV